MITSLVRIFDPALFNPKSNSTGALKYSCSLFFPKTDIEGVTLIKIAIDEVIETGRIKLWNGKIPDFHCEPLRDGDAELESGKQTRKEYKGHFFLNCATDNQPYVFGPDAIPLMQQDEIYTGCIVRADITPYAYINRNKNGIGWGLKKIILVEPPTTDMELSVTAKLMSVGLLQIPKFPTDLKYYHYLPTLTD